MSRHGEVLECLGSRVLSTIPERAALYTLHERAQPVTLCAPRCVLGERIRDFTSSDGHAEPRVSYISKRTLHYFVDCPAPSDPHRQRSVSPDHLSLRWAMPESQESAFRVRRFRD